MPDPRTVLAEIQARADKATPGPWKLWGGSVQTDRSGTGETNYAEMIAHTRDPDRGARTFNAQFIAKSRDDVPRLAALLVSILDCIELLNATSTEFDDDAIAIGIRMAAADIRGRFAALTPEAADV